MAFHFIKILNKAKKTSSTNLTLMNLTQGLHRVQEPVHDGRVQRESERVPGGAEV